MICLISLRTIVAWPWQVFGLVNLLPGSDLIVVVRNRPAEWKERRGFDGSLRCDEDTNSREISGVSQLFLINKCPAKKSSYPLAASTFEIPRWARWARTRPMIEKVGHDASSLGGPLCRCPGSIVAVVKIIPNDE
jgi:hypothetical protein